MMGQGDLKVPEGPIGVHLYHAMTLTNMTQ